MYANPGLNTTIFSVQRASKERISSLTDWKSGKMCRGAENVDQWQKHLSPKLRPQKCQVVMEEVCRAQSLTFVPINY